MDIVANQCCRADRTKAQAVDCLNTDPRLAIGDSPQIGHAARLACLGLAQLYARTVALFGPEVVIEADNAVNFGAGQIKAGSNLSHGGLADVAEGRLNVVQDRQQGTSTRTVALDDFCYGNARFHKRTVQRVIGFVK